MKRIVLILICMLVIIGLPACRNGEAEKQETNDKAGTPLTLVSGGKSRYTMIYPANASSVELDAVALINVAFSQDMSVEMVQKKDSTTEGENREETYKLLIGQTDYRLSKLAYEGLRYHDFRILTDETSLAIAFYSSKGCSEAIKWLRENVFNRFSDGELIMDAADVQQAPKAGYEIDPWMIGGNDLRNYKIVYADGLDYEQAAALRNAVAKKSGWMLEMVSDREAAPTPYEILVGETNRPESAIVEVPALNFAIQTVNNKLVIKTGGEHSWQLLMKNFEKLIVKHASVLESGKDVAQMEAFFDNPNNVEKHAETDLRIMSANVLAEIGGYNDSMEKGFAFERRMEIFFAALDFYAPDVVGLQEFCMSWYEGIEKYDSIDKWEVLKFQNPKLPKEYVLSTVMYRKDLFTLVDSGMTYYSKNNNGRCRCISWAVLKDRTTGAEFCVVSTHWDGGNGDINGETANTLAQVEELSAFVNEMAKKYPVFTTGDFNRNEYTNAFKTYLSNINSVDAMYAAAERLNVAGSYHNWGSSNASAGSCDHITATKNVTFLKFETAMYNQQIYASDHAWLVADAKFNR